MPMSTYKQEKENKPLNIPSTCNEHYNANFTLKGLNNALNECKGSSPGPDYIHYHMLKNLNISGKLFLLRLYITVEGFHTKGWTKIFFCNYFDFFTSKSVLKSLERLYAKNFIKIMKVEILVKIE
jgi:hypothetical protein